jgi:hypothetical protein
METLSPSFFNQREICPSSIVGESFGMITFVAIRFLKKNSHATAQRHHIYFKFSSRRSAVA